MSKFCYSCSSYKDKTSFFCSSSKKCIKCKIKQKEKKIELLKIKNKFNKVREYENDLLDFKLKVEARQEKKEKKRKITTFENGKKEAIFFSNQIYQEALSN